MLILHDCVASQHVSRGLIEVCELYFLPGCGILHSRIGNVNKLTSVE